MLSRMDGAVKSKSKRGLRKGHAVLLGVGGMETKQSGPMQVGWVWSRK